MYKELSENLLLIDVLLIGIINFIIIIVNFVQKNIKIGIMYIIILAITFGGMLWSISENYNVLYLAFGILGIILSIINLVFNKKTLTTKRNKIPIILFVIIIIIQIIAFSVPIILSYINIKNFEEAIPNLQADDGKTFVYYNLSNNYVFIDEQGNKINEKDYDDVEYDKMSINIDGNVLNLGCAERDGKIIVIDTKGQELFELCNLFTESPTYIMYRFLDYIENSNKYCSYKDYSIIEENVYDENKVLTRYTEENKKFEDNENNKYMYFKNANISDKVLQIAINKNEIEEDTKFKDLYKPLYYRSDIVKIDEFYGYQREYYLIDFNTNEKIKLECNNLIYDAHIDENTNSLIENILLYSNGDIPYYDNEESGFFDKAGNKNRVDSDYIVKDVTDDYIIIMEKYARTTYFIPKETSEHQRKYYNLSIYDKYYVSYDEDNLRYEILDKKLNIIATSEHDVTPLLYDNFIVITKDGYEPYIYYYDGENIKLIDKTDKWIFMATNFENDVSIEDNSLYSQLNIISD